MKKKSNEGGPFVQWESPKFGTHLDMGVHWVDHGFVGDVHRFTMFCAKDPVWIFLRDLSTGEDIRLELGTMGEGQRLAHRIVADEHAAREKNKDFDANRFSRVPDSGR